MMLPEAVFSLLLKKKLHLGVLRNFVKDPGFFNLLGRLVCEKDERMTSKELCESGFMSVWRSILNDGKDFPADKPQNEVVQGLIMGIQCVNATNAMVSSLARLEEVRSHQPLCATVRITLIIFWEI